MSILIGNAAKDENNKYTGGKPGDQTSQEVYSRPWYNRPWNVVIRAKDPIVAEALAKNMEDACKNDNLGYDYGVTRIQAMNEAQKVDYHLDKITTPCNCDCSSLVAVCCQAAGVPTKYTLVSNRPFVTSEIEKCLSKSGMFEILKDSKYLNQDAYLKRGDILLNTKSHVAIALGNGSKSSGSTSSSSSTSTSTPRKNLKKGDKGEDVKAMQTKLIAAGYSCGSYGADGSFGPATDAAVRQFQKDMGIEVDGIFGPISTQKLNEKLANPSPSPKTETYTVIAQSGLNMRSGEGTNYPVIRVLPFNAKVNVIEKPSSGWYKVEYSGSTGYASSKWLN